jgi:tetratricopeptide (TPR) repeat protein
MLRAHRKLKDNESSLKYTAALVLLREEFEKSDRDFSETFRLNVLLPEIPNCVLSGAYEAAVTYCRDTLKESESLPRDVKETVLDALFTCLTKLGRSEDIVSHLHTWHEGGEDNLEYWRMIMVLHDRIREHTIAAVRSTGDIDRVCAFYAPSEDSALDDGWTKIFRFVQGAVQVLGPQSQDHFQQGIDLLETSLQHDSEDVFSRWVTDQSIKTLATVFLARATGRNTADRLDKNDQMYQEKLTELCRKKPIVDLSPNVPLLCLIRLHVLRDDLQSARDEAMEFLYKVFDDWPSDLQDDSLYNRFYGLSKVLTALGDDQNAIAAWQVTKPAPKSAEDCSKDITPEPYITDFRCDGCRRVWDHGLEDCWVCKECPDVQYCNKCYKRIQEGQPCHGLCSKNHDMLYLPCFHVEVLRGIEDDQMIVSGERVLRRDWLGQIRQEYKVQQQDIEIWKLDKAKREKAAMSLQRIWRRESFVQ